MVREEKNREVHKHGKLLLIFRTPRLQRRDWGSMSSGAKGVAVVMKAMCAQAQKNFRLGEEPPVDQSLKTGIGEIPT